MGQRDSFPEPMWEQLNRIIKDKGAIVLFGSEPFSSALRMSNIRRYKYDWIWDKDKPFGVFLAKIQPLRTYENISVFNAGYYYPIMRDARPDRIRPLSKGNKEGSKTTLPDVIIARSRVTMTLQKDIRKTLFESVRIQKNAIIQ